MLYELAVTDQIPWLWGGSGLTPAAFQETLVNDVMVSFGIEDARTGQPVGYLAAYNANFHHGFCFVSVVLHPDFKLRVWPIEGAMLFLHYLFVKYGLRHLYLQAAAPSLDEFRSGIGSAFEVEAHFKDRLMLNGVPQDLYVLTISRESWFSGGATLVDRIAQPTPSPRTYSTQ